MQQINELIKISKYAGMREDLIQASGGNSSIKLDSKRMAIKASGIQLADISKESGYSIVDYSIILQYLNELVAQTATKSAKEILECTLLKGKRSSIETFLHAITGRVTLHTHSVAVNVLATRRDGMKLLEKMFPEALLVGYSTPGLKLAELYYRTFLTACESGKKVYPIIFLKNHGLIISGDTAEIVIELTEKVCKQIEQVIGINNDHYRHAYELYNKFRQWEPKEDKIIVKVENEAVLKIFKTYKYNIWDFQISPDCIVFCGKKAFIYDRNCDKDTYMKFAAKFTSPVIICYGQELYIRAESVKKAREIESVLSYSARVAAANQGQELILLSNEEQDFLLNWDAEKYRQKMGE